MTGSKEALLAHLATGTTTVCRAWSVRRPDGVVLGFTDHDHDLEFEGIRFAAGSGLTARVLEQVTGMAPDNSEALGVLSSDAVTEQDILAGRYDGAEVRVWLVNWARPDERMVEFAGRTGDIVRSGSSFRVELRGLTDVLNRTAGRVFQAGCDASLGDHRCRFDLDIPGYRTEAEILWIADGFRFGFAHLEGFADRWFARGEMRVLNGVGVGQVALVRLDRSLSDGREISVWTPFGLMPEPGDRVQLTTGCDKRAATCRDRFNNYLNFRGFPNIPGEDWLTSYPTSGSAQTGGKLR